MALAPEQTAAYAVIIDDILAASDLNTVSAKRIRKGLQDKVDQDLTPYKHSITDLIMERFDKIQSKQATDGSIEPAPTANGNGYMVEPVARAKTPEISNRKQSRSPYASPNKRKADSEDIVSDVVDSPAPKKPRKAKKEEIDSDEAYAAKLQAELNAQARPTRGGGARRKPPVKQAKKPKKKSSTKIKGSDDSDLSDSDVEKPEKEKKGGFHKQMTLSEPLSAMLGEITLSRPQTVKKIWEYVRARDLQDPNDKRQIRCDDAMRAVFKQDKVHMFTMNKLLANHLYAPEE